ncbi:MAG: 50S ribosomal protein L4, partial [Bacteroidetes bacterium]|nr:50S ribosomal protein L4 [Bacteroidota bacterium]
MKLPVYKTDGSKTRGKVELDASVFGIAPNDHVLWLDVRRLQASRRQGTHKTKERSEVAGSMRKLYRQKGTGMARSGTAKSPLRRSGGRTFGPRPRKYTLKLNQKTRRLARCSALSYKAQEDGIRVVERIAFETPNTRQLIDMIAALDLDGQKVLFLTETNNEALYRSSCNLAKVHVGEARNASTEALLGAGVVVFEEGALAVLTEALGGAPAAETAPVEEPPVEEPSAEADEPADEAVPVEEPPVDVEEPADEAPTDEVEEPADEAPTDEVEEPADEAPTAEVEEPADEAASADEAPTDEVEEAADEAVPVEVEEAADEAASADEAPTDEVEEAADEAA